MNRVISLIVFVSLLTAVSVFGQNAPGLDIKIPVFKSVSYFAVEISAGDEYSIPNNIANNQFYLESIRLNILAETLFDYGDYETSIQTAEEAIRQAQLSDQFVASHLIIEAKGLLDRAYDYSLINYYPDDVNAGREYIELSLISQLNEEWIESIALSSVSIEILAALQIPEGAVPIHVTTAASTASTTSSSAISTTPASIVTTTPVTPAHAPLPSQYTVRPWATTRDCLWNIAGYPWVYGDPRRWPELYEANKTRMPQPNNPDLIHPGFVINIPSSTGEIRQGMWDPNTNYGF